MLEQLTRAARHEAIAYVAQRPYENAFLQWILEGGHGPNAPDEIILSRDRDGSINGAIYYGTQLVLAAADDAAVDAFAIETRRHPGLRSFVGPQDRIERLWAHVRTWHRPPVITRARQPIYVLRPGALPPLTGDVEVRQATLAEADIVMENSAQMMLHELGYDPRANRTIFAASVRRAIGAGQWWVWIDNGELRFQLNVGARTSVTAQLQGVWTPPALRKRGYASAALGQISRRLLRDDTQLSLSLYVNDFNTDAIALYERLGFTSAGTMSTFLFG